MAAVVVFGTQWGDEGKGRVVNLYAQEADVVVRYNGGANAGHTVIIGEETYKLRLVPSGIFYPGALCVMASGMVIDPLDLAEEIASLKERGVDVSGLRISGGAHVIMPYHRLLDRLEEERRAGKQIGTTCRGIGPAYTDKVARHGIRMWDLLDENRLRDLVQATLEAKNPVLKALYGHGPLDPKEVIAQVAPVVAQISEYVAETEPLVSDAVRARKNVLFEGAQGTYIDIDHGTYPYVTSSHAIPAGACLGTGVGPRDLDRIIGVVKAYCSRVGAGPFTTELNDEIGHTIRERGQEYGTVTRRPRRCGWLDLVALRTAVVRNSVDALAVTRVDILDTLDPIRFCLQYEYRGQRLDHFPSDTAVLEKCNPVYDELPGWKEDTSAARSLEDLPSAARRYLDRICEEAQTELAMVCVGPRRHEAIVTEAVFT